MNLSLVHTPTSSTLFQVRFIHEAFRRLRPGVPIRALHGGMKQMKRTAVYNEFCEAKAMVLFATDIAAWVWTSPL